MHTIWKGTISIGMVQVPVKLYSALEDRDIALHYIHKPCGSQLQNVRKCSKCNSEVDWGEVGKGYQYENDRMVIIEKEELDQIANDKSKQVLVYEFVKDTEVDPIFVEKTYYMGPEQVGVNAYYLFLHALKTTGKVAISKFTMRSKTHLALIRAKDNCLLLETMHYSDEVRDITHVPNLVPDYSIKRSELLLAKKLIEFMTGKFELTNYNDEYRAQLISLIEKKAAGEKFAPERLESAPNIVDLVTALQESIRTHSKKSDDAPVTRKQKPKTKKIIKHPEDNDMTESVS
ncbi:Ku protein [Paenibacillus antri]|uniref:Non-homologous end joining protein Ku n=1 Tax=Paenibacillus antri TaxID=2582848 RepID=A0A5R9GAS9_9BACL|nr:Ku protein [Paenibacillus antri]TLS52831.1 Ku protein [Paenibacillus antri]